MLSKLLKHEFRATGRVLLPLYLLLFVSAGLFRLFMYLSVGYDLQGIHILRGVTTAIYALTVLAVTVLTGVLMVYRFYKNFMTDEGYLMFTLPVSTAELLWAKLLVALVWSAVTLLADGLSAILAGAVDESTLSELLATLEDTVALAPGHSAAYLLELLVELILGSWASYLLIYAAIALGHSFSNHKILLSVVFFFGFTIVLQTFGTFGGIYAMVLLDQGVFDFERVNLLAIPHYLLLSGILSAGVQFVLFYLLTLLMLKKRLNLQ